MKLNSLKSLGVVLLTATFLFSCNQDSNLPSEDNNQMEAAAEPGVIPGQYIVVYNNDNSSRSNTGLSRGDAREAVASQTQEILNETGVQAQVLEVFTTAVRGVVLKMNDDKVNNLKKSRAIAFIEPDRIVTLSPPCGTPNNPCSGGGGGSGSGQEKPYGITRVNGGATYTGSHVAWIIDTGVDLDHEDLNVDASRGFNAFTSGRDAKSLDDGNGHGTHVSGTIAAIDNGVGVVGVAAGATVIPVKVLDSRGSGSYSGVIAGVDWVAAHGNSGDVANMSLGGPVSQALDDAVKNAASKGIKFALAAGNESDDANNHSPARANGANIYTISAMDSSDTFAYFSNYANPPVDYCAPGVNILSCWKDGGYNTISGTSMASPHAAGVLLWGNASSDGNVKDDPDGNADPIIYN